MNTKQISLFENNLELCAWNEGYAVGLQNGADANPYIDPNLSDAWRLGYTKGLAERHQ